MNFASYTECLLQAFLLHSKTAEVLKRKKEIIDEVAYFHNYTPSRVLYVGFNPVILVDESEEIAVTAVSQKVQEYLTSAGVKYTYIPDDKIKNFYKKFNSVVALDEYFTFAADDNEQKNRVLDICNLATDYVITTCRDYKNQEFKDREFSIPALVKNGKENNVFLEFHDHNIHDKNSWTTYVYQINGSNFAMSGPYARKAMYFKQLAKFSHDAGAVGYNVHKNLMYKSLIKKNYEHVVSFKFDR
jgi:hypothetical protein